MLMSIILAVLVAILVMVAESLLCETPLPFTKIKEDGEVVYDKGNHPKRYGLEMDSMVLLKSCIIGLVVGFVNYLAPKTGKMLWLAPILLVLMLAVTGYLVWRWKEEGSNFKEMVPFLLLTPMIYFTSMSAASMTVALFQNGFLRSLILALPLIAMVGSVGFYIANACFFQKEEKEEDGDENGAKNWKIVGWIVAVLTALILLGLLFFKLSWGALYLNLSDDDFPVFYNSMLQKDGDESNDYDFGPSLAELNAAEGEDEKPEEEYTVADYDADFRERISKDPALFAAVAYWTDTVTGSGLLQEYRDQHPNEPMAAINAAVDDFIANPKKFEEYLKVFDERLASATVSLKNGKGIKDQMYMNPYTTDGVPEVVVFETTQSEGTFLVYTFNIKGNAVNVEFRTECGYQPTNVAKLLGVTPGTNPTDPGEPDPPGPPDPPDPPGPPTPPPTPPQKDPTEGTQGDPVKPNDNPGPGPDTNNGVGAQYSSEQTEDGSIFLPNHDAYQQIIDGLDKINETQREGGDPNTPTYTPPASSNTTVDGNAENGTGYGGIDVSTPISKPATTVNGEKVTNDGAGEAWGGPPN